ncbi:MAG: hypothetical protein HQK53_15440 [Oligoflexia bacterium]|nr:hypothetical protein [Oligoflexia bacterium]
MFIVLVSLVLVVQVALLITTCEKTEAAAAPAPAVDNPRLQIVVARQLVQLTEMRRELDELKATLRTLTDSNTGLKIGGTKVINGAGLWTGNPTGLVGPQGPQGPQGADGTNLIHWSPSERGPRNGDSFCNYWGGAKWKCITTAVGPRGCWDGALPDGLMVGCIVLP